MDEEQDAVNCTVAGKFITILLVDAIRKTQEDMSSYL